MGKYEMIPGKLIDTSMSSTPPQGMYNAFNMTDEIAEQLITVYPGYAKYFKRLPNTVHAPIQSVNSQYKSPFYCAIIIPTRGDRKKLLAHGLELLNRQTVQPDKVIIVDYKPERSKIDLTQRYRRGYQEAKKYDVVIFWEDDDYYYPTYIERILKLWKQNPGLELIGSNSTTYYHIFDKKYCVIPTKAHSSMMNTSMRGGLDIDWPSDDAVFLDIKLWSNMKGKLFDIGDLMTGIKHGIGLCGGKGHNGKICNINDANGQYLKGLVDSQSFEFYRNYDANN